MAIGLSGIWWPCDMACAVNREDFFMAFVFIYQWIINDKSDANLILIL